MNKEAVINQLMKKNGFSGSVLDFIEQCKNKRASINDIFSFTLLGNDVVVYIDDTILMKIIILMGMNKCTKEYVDEQIADRLGVLVDLFSVLVEYGYENMVVVSSQIGCLAVAFQTMQFKIVDYPDETIESSYGVKNLHNSHRSLAVLSKEAVKKPDDKDKAYQVTVDSGLKI